MDGEVGCRVGCVQVLGVYGQLGGWLSRWDGGWVDRLVDGGCLNGSTGCACGSRVMVGERVGEQQGGWLVGGT